MDTQGGRKSIYNRRSCEISSSKPERMNYTKSRHILHSVKFLRSGLDKLISHSRPLKILIIPFYIVKSGIHCKVSWFYFINCVFTTTFVNIPRYFRGRSQRHVRDLKKWTLYTCNVPLRHTCVPSWRILCLGYTSLILPIYFESFWEKTFRNEWLYNVEIVNETLNTIFNLLKRLNANEFWTSSFEIWNIRPAPLTAILIRNIHHNSTIVEQNSTAINIIHPNMFQYMIMI